MSKKEIRSSLRVVVTVVVTLFSACGAFVPQSTLHGRLARQNCLDVANCRHARPSILTCSLSEDATRRALLKAVALWPLTLFTENAAAALAVAPFKTRREAGTPKRGFDKGEPLPDAAAQKAWGTRLGSFTLEQDGYDEVRGEIVKLITADRTLGAGLVRLSFHSSGTYDKISKTGGSSKGTVRFKEELSHEANKGLEKVLPVLEPIKRKYPAISYADLYTLAGAVSVEALGGPHIVWKGGREDSSDPADASPDGRLPDADKGSTRKTMAHLRTVFGRMGFTDQELVALSGAHTLGKCHYEDSGYEGEWSETPWKFDNSYFNILLQPQALDAAEEPWLFQKNVEPQALDAVEEPWIPLTLPNGHIQFVDPNQVYIMLPSDLALLKDPQTAKWVEAYARNSPLFFKDFAAAYSKLLALGTSG